MGVSLLIVLLEKKRYVEEENWILSINTCLNPCLMEVDNKMIKNSVLCIFPPGWIATAPYLALPQLKGYADSIGETLDIVDDNVMFFDYLFSTNTLMEIHSDCQNAFKNYKQNSNMLEGKSLKKFQQLYRGLKYANDFQYADEYKRVLRTERNIDKYMYAYRVLESAQDLLGYHYNMTISQNIISSNKYVECTAANLLKFVNDKKNNIFIDYYSNNSLIDRCLNYDYVGISITSSSQMLSAFTLIHLLRKKDKMHRVVIYLGGNFITRVIENMDESSTLINLIDKVDFVSIYEGEPVLKNIFSKEFNYKVNHNIAYVDNLILKKNECERHVYSIKPPPPDFDGFQLNKYFLPELVLPVLSSKNCYNNCAFCTVPKGTAGNHYIQFDFSHLITNINHLMQKYGVKCFTFNDEVFSLKRMISFSRQVISEGVKIRWLCETRFDFVPNCDDFTVIAAAGCKSIQFGLESYNQRVLDLMNKNIKIENIAPIVYGALSAGISVHLFCILGFPGETEEEVMCTRNFAIDVLKKSREEYHLPLSSIGYGTFGLEKGSTVFREPLRFGVHVIDEDKQTFDYKYDYVVDMGITPKRAEEIEIEMSGSSPLSSVSYIPENYILCEAQQVSSIQPKEEYQQKIFENVLMFNPISGISLPQKTFFLHGLNDDIIMDSYNDPENFTTCERAIFEYYFLKKREKINQQNMQNVILNPLMNYYIDEQGEFMAHDLLKNVTFILSDYFYKVIQMMKEYGVEDFIDSVGVSGVITMDTIIDIFDEMYSVGILLLPKYVYLSRDYGL